MTMLDLTVMQYGSHPRQRVWVGEGAVPGGSWLVVIHGGIWADERTTEQAGKHLAHSLRGAFNGVASIDYRLSPEVVHPVHLQDCALAIEKVYETFEFDEITIAGHSAGAYIAGQLASFKMLPDVRLNHVICLEGIYELSSLIEEYPDYKHWIVQAFGDETQWRDANPLWQDIAPLLLLHSKEDELLSIKQPTLPVLTAAKLVLLPQGKHDEVFEKLDISHEILPYL